MKTVSGLSLLVVLFPSFVFAATGRDGLEVTITDTFDFKMRLTAVTLRKKAPPGAETKVMTFEHIPIVREGKEVNLWLAQVATAEFAAKEGGEVEVKAVLQGKGDKMAGTIADPARYHFEGVTAADGRQGQPVRFPLLEVKALENHTPYDGALEPPTILPMPRAGEDIFWVSSVPLGAQVFVKPFDCKAAEVWKDYIRMGETPFACELGPGKYAVKILVPEKLASGLRPAMKLGEDANPFEHDGWGEVNFRTGENVIAAVTYTVIKVEGQPATLISLFQKKGATLEQVVESFPTGHNFNFDEKKLEGDLLYQQVPKNDIALMLRALHRGGKIIWHGPDKSLMIEITAGAQGWKMGGAIRPKGK